MVDLHAPLHVRPTSCDGRVDGGLPWSHRKKGGKRREGESGWAM